MLNLLIVQCSINIQVGTLLYNFSPNPLHAIKNWKSYAEFYLNYNFGDLEAWFHDLNKCEDRIIVNRGFWLISMLFVFIIIRLNIPNTHVLSDDFINYRTFGFETKKKSLQKWLKGNKNRQGFIKIRVLSVLPD